MKLRSPVPVLAAVTAVAAVTTVTMFAIASLGPAVAACGETGG